MKFHEAKFHSTGTVLPFIVISCMQIFSSVLFAQKITSLKAFTTFSVSVTHIHTLAISTPFDLNTLNCGTLESLSTIEKVGLGRGRGGQWLERRPFFLPKLIKTNLQGPKLAARKPDPARETRWPAVQDASGWPSGLCRLQWNLPR